MARHQMGDKPLSVAMLQLAILKHTLRCHLMLMNIDLKDAYFFLDKSKQMLG